MLGYAGLNTFGSVGGGSPSFSGVVTADSLTLTGASAAGVSLNFTNGAGGMFFNNPSASSGYFISGVSAANAGSTAATAGFKFYTTNALDAADWVFNIGNQSNGSSLFSVTYAGTTSSASFQATGSINAGTKYQLGGRDAIVAGEVTTNDSAVIGAVADSAANAAVVLGNTIALTAGSDRYVSLFTRGANGATVVARVDSSGGYQEIMGTSTGFATGIGIANATTADVVSSGAGSTLISYTLPANALVTTNRGLRITAWGTCVNNANAKTVSLAFGSQTVISKQLAVSLANGTWKLEATVLRSGASTQDIYGEGWNEDAIAVSGTDGPTILYAATRTAGTQTETATIVIKGVATTATTTDITMDALIVEYL